MHSENIRNYHDNIPEDCGFNCIFPHTIPTPNTGISYGWIQWIANNINGRWGWHWNGPANSYNCIMSFEDEKDAVWFALNYDFKREKYQ